jgi:hypothetical protein
MDCVRELNVKRRVVFRQNILAIAFFSHLYPSDWVPAFFQISNLIRSVLRRAEEDRDRNHRRQIVGNAAGEEKVETGLIAGLIQIRGRVVGIGRGAVGWGLCGIGRVSYKIDEGAVVEEQAGVYLADGIAGSMPQVAGSVWSRLVRGLSHDHTNPARRDRL